MLKTRSRFSRIKIKETLAQMFSPYFLFYSLQAGPVSSPSFSLFPANCAGLLFLRSRNFNETMSYTAMRGDLRSRKLAAADFSPPGRHPRSGIAFLPLYSLLTLREAKSLTERTYKRGRKNRKYREERRERTKPLPPPRIFSRITRNRAICPSTN